MYFHTFLYKKICNTLLKFIYSIKALHVNLIFNKELVVLYLHISIGKTRVCTHIY
jgi:hypothetical protein